MKIIKPKLPPRLQPDSFPTKTKWNPRLPVSATDNIPPQSMWPIKRGEALFFIEHEWNVPLCIKSGRVSWFNPARPIDGSCVTTVGHPFFNVKNHATSGKHSHLVSADRCFPFTVAGWKSCLLALAKIIQSAAVESLEQSSRQARQANEEIKLSATIRQQAARIKPGRRHP